MNTILNLLHEHQLVMSKLELLVPAIKSAADRIVQSLRNGGKVFFMGNGGSAADSQHLAAELVGRFKAERQAIPALALTTDTSMLTAISNDYDYSLIFSRQLEAFCQKNDIVVGISTSGNSKNILKGIETANSLGAFTIGMTGEQGGQLLELADICLCVPSLNVARIQEAHIFIGHTICEIVEEQVMANTLYEEPLLQSG